MMKATSAPSLLLLVLLACCSHALQNLKFPKLPTLKHPKRPNSKPPKPPDSKFPKLPDLKFPKPPDSKPPKPPDLKFPKLLDLKFPKLPDPKPSKPPDSKPPKLPDLKFPKLPDLKPPKLPNLTPPKPPTLKPPKAPNLKPPKLPTLKFPQLPDFGNPPGSTTARQLEDKLLEAIGNNSTGRLDNSGTIDALVELLENRSASFSIPNPAIAPQIYGSWRLLYTTNTGTASPIQRRAVQSSQFPIYQDIVVNPENATQLLVKQIVEFSETSKLSVDAIASTAAYPVPELTARQSDGTILGVNVLGVSLTGKEAEPAKPNQRIDFVFDEGNFDLNGTKIPYPVPFRFPLLRDWVKGWIDITYLSDRIRISRGNKGTTFVLQKVESKK